MPSAATLICHHLPPFNWLDWPGNVPDLAPNNVLLCRLSVPDWAGRLGTLYETLSPDEQQRAGRLRQVADQQRFVLGRGGLRRVAGYVTAQAPAEVQFRLTEHGKPELTNADGWHVNLSHSGNWVLISLAKQPVGVDVEQPQPGVGYRELIPACFGPAEQQALAAACQRSPAAEQRLFYTLWTRKEAIIKATGLGMTEQLTEISVLDSAQTVPVAAIGATGLWQVRSFWLDDTHPAAVAVQQLGLVLGFTL